MKKKRMKYIIFILCCIVCIFGLMQTNSYKIQKANALYGLTACTKTNGNTLSISADNVHSGVGCTVMTPYTCGICGKKLVNGTAPAPKLCEKCSQITRRCMDCGGLLE